MLSTQRIIGIIKGQEKMIKGLKQEVRQLRGINDELRDQVKEATQMTTRTQRILDIWRESHDSLLEDYEEMCQEAYPDFQEWIKEWETRERGQKQDNSNP